MTSLSLVLLAFTIVLSSFVSGVFGMARGMILLDATKAVVQSLSHVVRAGYFGSVSGIGNVPLWACVPAILLAIAGTSLASFVLERMTDHGFRRWTRRVIFAVSAVYLVRAASLLWPRLMP
jgi:uncharacterized membrane protein YfcA